MTLAAPLTDLDSRFSSPGAAAIPWHRAEQELGNAEIYWLSTTRDGRPHVAPLLAVWVDGALYFCTGETEQKARNLAKNANVVITTGCNSMSEGLDIVVEGEAMAVGDEDTIRRLGDAFETKYGEYWRMAGSEGVLAFRVVPTRAFGFGRGDGSGPPPKGGFSQTRWRF